MILKMVNLYYNFNKINYLVLNKIDLLSLKS